MAITRYAGDRFTIAPTDTKPTGVMPGAFLIDSGNQTSFVKTGYTVDPWAQIAGGGGGGNPGGSNTQVQFNDNGSFGGTTGLTFDGQRLYANNFQLSGILYDSNASVGEGGMVLANEGTTGVNWKSIESVLSGVGGSGVANYVAKWSDEDTLTSGTIYDDGNVGIGTSIPSGKLNVRGDSIWMGNASTDASSRLMFAENSAGAQGFSLLYAGSANPTIDGTVFTAQANSFNIHRHDNSIPGTAAITIKRANGYVGIGEADPSSKLSIGGNSAGTLKPTLSIKDESAGASLALRGGAPRIFMDSMAAGIPKILMDGRGIEFKDGTLDSEGNVDVKIAADGKVGIGTTAPDYILHVNTAAGNTVGKFESQGANSQAIVRVENDARKWDLKVDGTASDKFKLRDSTAAADRLVVKSDGNVGIGTDDPLWKFQVDGTAFISGSVLIPNSSNYFGAYNAAGNGYIQAFYVDANDNLIVNKSNFQGNTIIKGDTIDLQPYDSLDVARSTLVVTGAGVGVPGSVGIGLNGLDIPQHTLHVSGDMQISGYLYDSTSSTGVDGYILTSKEDGPQWKMIEDVLSGVGGNGTANYIPKWEDSDTIGDSLIYDNGSNVGIGTADPQRFLHVNGDAIVSGKFYDQTNSTGDKGYVLTSDDNGPLWKASGDFDGLSGNLITTGQTLTTDINEVASNLVLTGVIVDTNTAGVAANVTNIATNVTNIATNVTNISTNASNLVLTGAIVDDVSGNLITTGQYLTDEINTVSGLIPPTVVDGAGVTGYTARWFDGNTLTTGTLYDDGIKVGIGTAAPAALLEVNESTDNTAIIRIDSGETADDTPASALDLFAGSSTADADKKHFRFTNLNDANSAGQNQLQFQSRDDDGSYGATLMVIEHDGGVGIGTNDISSGGKLQVYNGNVMLDQSAALNYYTIQLKGPAGSLFGGSRFFDAHSYNAAGNAEVARTWFTHSSEGIFSIAHSASGTPATRLSITTDGKVGIGTTNPAYNLQVKGAGSQSISVSSTSTHAAVRIDRFNTSQDANLIFTTAGVNKWRLATGLAGDNEKLSIYDDIADANMMTFLSAVGVGIGTDTPSVRFHVETSVADVLSKFINTDTTNGYGLLVKAGGSASGRYIATFRDAANNTRMHLLADGNVGIGSVTPAAVLDIVDGAGTTYAKLGYDTYASFQFYRNLTASSTSTPVMMVRQTHPDDDQTALVVDQDGSGYILELIEDSTTRVVVQADGNVGIGTNAPAAVLDIRGDDSTSAGSGLIIGQDALTDGGTTTVPNAWLKFYLNNIRNGAMIKAGRDSAYGSAALADGNLQFHTALNDTLAEHMRILSGGEVGIGTTTTSSYKLKVEGITWLNDQVFIAGNDTAPPTSSNSQDFGAIRMSDGALRSMYQGCTATYGWIQVMSSTNHATNYPLYLNPNGGAISFNGAYTFPTADGTAGYHLQTDGSGTITWAAGGAGTVTGTGTANYISKWTGTNSQGNSSMSMSSEQLVMNRTGGGVIMHANTNANNTIAGGNATNDGGNVAFFGSTSASYAGAVKFRTGSTETMIIASDGKVGIGTTAPAYKLEVKASVTGDWLSRIYNTATTSNPSGLLVRIDDADSTGTILGVNNNGAYHMVVKGDGKVGIGTAAPDGTLHIETGNAGTITAEAFADNLIIENSDHVGISLRSPDAKRGYILFQSATNDRVATIKGEYNSGNEKLSFAVDDDDKMIILDTGNVGIGTNAPASKLQVSTTDAVSVLTIHRDGSNVTTANTSLGRIQFAQDYDAGQQNWGHIEFLTTATSAYRTNLDFHVKSTSGNVMRGMTINGTDSDGPRVGIGTNTPLSPLDVISNAGASHTDTDYDGVTITSNTASEPSIITFRPANAAGQLANVAKIGAISEGSTGVYNGNLVFSTRTSGTMSEHMRITSAGEVGIGTTTTSSYKLKVEGITWLNDVTFIAGNNTAPPTTSNSQDFGAIRMSNGTTVSMYQGATNTYGWVQVSKSTNHATNYPLYLNPNGGAISFNGAYTFPTADGTAGYHLQTDGAGAVTWEAGGAGTVTGTGTANYVSKWTGASSQGNSTISDNGSTVTVASDFHVYKVGSDKKLWLSEGTSGSGLTNVQLNSNGDSYLKGGDVGIGVAAPGARLHVVQTGSDEAFRIDGASGGFAMIVKGGSTYNTMMRGGVTIGNTFAASAPPSNGLITEGSVGIGTTNPGEKLEVVGNVFANVSNAGGFMLTTASNSGLVRNNATGLALRTNTTDQLIVDNSGKVGIGTDTPRCILSVSKAVTTGYEVEDCYLMLGGQEASAGSTRLIGFGYVHPTSTHPPANIGYLQNSNAGFTNGDLIFRTRGTTTNVSPTERLRITYDGKVGIGTNAPSTLLEVTTSNNSSDGTFSSWSTTDGHSGTIIFTKSASATIGTYAATADGERLGTIAVYGSDSSNTKSQSTAAIYFEQDGAATAARVPSRIKFFTAPPSNNMAERMVIRADGNVGIGTTNPTKLFHVNGASLLGGTTTILGNLLPGISSLMDIGTSSFKWRNLSLSGTADIDSTLTVGGGENITGRLVFTDGVSGGTAPSSGKHLELFYYDTNDEGYIQAYDRDANAYLNIRYAALTHVFTGNATVSGYLQATGNISTSGTGTITSASSLIAGGTLYVDENIRHTGDTNNYINFTTDTQKFFTDNVLALTIDSSQNVGIGTTNPSGYKLKVEGTTWFNDQTFIAGNNTAPPTTSNSQDFGAIRMSDGALRSMYQGCTATYGWIQVMSSTNHATNYPLYLNPNGGAISFNGAYTFPTADGTAGYHLQTDGAGAVTWEAGTAGFVDGSGTAGYIPKWTDGDTIGNSIIQDNGSMVTISGTGGDGTEILRLRGTASGTFNWISAALHANLTAGETSIHLFGKAESTKNSGYIGYRYYGVASNANLVTIGHYGSNYLVNIKGDGNVGIGTTNPGSLLDVNGAFKAGGNCQLGDSYSDYHNVYGSCTFREDGTEPNNIYVKNTTNAGKASIRFNDNTGDDQFGYIRYAHSDSQSNNTGNSIHFDTTETSLALILDKTAGDSGFYLGSIEDSANYMAAIRGGGDSYVTIGNSVNFGVGTRTPTGKLSVHGTGWDGGIYLENTTGTTGGRIIVDSDGMKFRTAIASDNFYWRDSGNDTNMILLDNGNFGVGDATPTNRLDVKNNSENVWVGRFENAASSNGLGVLIVAGNDANDFIFEARDKSSNTTKFGVMGDGKVGIGTTNPQELLQINSNSGDAAIRVDRQAASNEAAIKFGTNGTENWRLGNADSGHTNLQGTEFFISTAGSVAAPQFVIEASGLVGIGTATPATILHIASTSVPTLRIHHDSTSSAAALIQLMRGTTDTFGGDAYTDWQIHNVGGDLKFQYNDTAAGSLQTPFAISYLGAVSIGAYTLPTADGTAGYHLQTNGSGAVTWQPGGSGTVTGTGTANYVSKWTGASSQGNSLIQDDGSKVGIGTDGSSGGKLQVYGGGIMIDQSGTGAKYIVFQKGPIAGFLGGSVFFDAYSYNAAGNANVARTFFTHDSDGVFSIAHTDTGTPALAISIDTSANVGIGTTAPGAYKLRVQGDVYISGTLTEASSLGIKENIETYSPSLEMISKMRPVRYNKKKSRKKEVGLVAEELAEMFPELVEMDEKGNPSGVNYSRAVAVLLHGFKELYKEVKEIKEKI